MTENQTYIPNQQDREMEARLSPRPWTRSPLLLDSFDPPERSLYRARLADFVDQQLGMLLQRTRLASAGRN